MNELAADLVGLNRGVRVRHIVTILLNFEFIFCVSCKYVKLNFVRLFVAKRDQTGEGHQLGLNLKLVCFEVLWTKEPFAKENELVENPLKLGKV